MSKGYAAAAAAALSDIFLIFAIRTSGPVGYTSQRLFEAAPTRSID
jgi:hypothetical protein